METYTIRLDPDEMAALEREAEDQGFSNRTEYIRYIIRTRPAVDPSTAETLTERMDELEKRLDRIENQDG
jgi:polyhydroxyalkanoate synthesis regulator phasin